MPLCIVREGKNAFGLLEGKDEVLSKKLEWSGMGTPLSLMDYYDY